MRERKSELGEVGEVEINEISTADAYVFDPMLQKKVWRKMGLQIEYAEGFNSKGADHCERQRGSEQSRFKYFYIYNMAGIFPFKKYFHEIIRK